MACQIVALTDAGVRERLATYLTGTARAPQFDVAPRGCIGRPTPEHRLQHPVEARQRAEVPVRTV
jgi:hypothetical protein